MAATGGQMKFSEKWLREWVDPALSTQQLADQLTMAGLEVEERASFTIDGLKVFVQLDFAYRDAKGVVILDWKTGKSDRDQSDIQLGCYILYACGKWNLTPDQVTATALYLADGVEKPAKLDEARLLSVREHIRESADEMLFPLSDPQQNIAEEESFDFTEDEHACRRCNFLKVCPKFEE